MEQEVTTHDIKVHGKEKPPKVRPGKPEVKPGEKVSFMALNTRATVTFPQDKWPFREPWQIVELGEQQENDVAQVTFTARDIDGDKEEFPYTVYCHSSGSNAEADSDPIIIIRR